MVDHGGSAFPAGVAFDPQGDANFTHGMTLRDWFAGQALAGLLASGRMHSSPGAAQEMLANHCYAMADVMLRKRRLDAQEV